MASDIWLRTILIVRKETRCCHIGYSYRLTARVLLYAPSHRQDSTYHGLCYTSRGALDGTRYSSMGPPWRIDPMFHHTISEHPYISLPPYCKRPFPVNHLLLFCFLYNYIKYWYSYKQYIECVISINNTVPHNYMLVICSNQCFTTGVTSCHFN